MFKKLNIEIAQRNNHSVFLVTEVLKDEILKSIQNTLKSFVSSWSDDIHMSYLIVSRLGLDLNQLDLGISAVATDEVFIHIDMVNKIVKINNHIYHYNEFAYGNIALMQSYNHSHIKTETSTEKL